VKKGVIRIVSPAGRCRGKGSLRKRSGRRKCRRWLPLHGVTVVKSLEEISGVEGRNGPVSHHGKEAGAGVGEVQVGLVQG